MLTPEFVQGRREHLEGRLAHVRERLQGELPEAHRTWKAGTLLPEIVAALERIARNCYGRCEDCGNEIPARRLALRPEARRCVPCQEEEDHGQTDAAAGLG